MNSALIVCLALFCGVVVSVQSSPCDTTSSMDNLDSSRLNGQWYGVQSLTQGAIIPDYKCMKENVQADANGRLTINIEYTKTSNNERIVRSAIGTPIEGRRSKLAFVNSAHPDRTDDLVIIDTDYNNYVIWMTCVNENYLVAVTAKQTSLTPATLELVKQKLREHNLNDELHQTVQDC